MERRNFLKFIALETGGLVVGGVGIADRVLTPTPPREANARDSFSNVEYNVNYRLRSTLLMTVGFSSFIGGIGAFFASRHMPGPTDQIQNT